MHRLQDEVVIRIRPQDLHELPAGRLRAKAIFKQLRRIRTPLSEVVIHIDGGDARATRPLLQPGQLRSHWKGIAKELVPVRKIEVVDDIDKDQGGGRLMAYIST